MARDQVVAKFKADVAIAVTPVNQYGDEIDSGAFRYTVEITERKLSDVMLRLERITAND